MIVGTRGADAVVPPSGYTVWLTVISAAAMAFLAVCALAAVLVAGRTADRWTEGLARTATIRIEADATERQAQTEATLEALRTTPGIASARVLSEAEQRALLEPWLGPDLPFDLLPVPTLIEVAETTAGPDREGLLLRLAAEAPDAVFDDHQRWRAPLVAAADRLRLIGWIALALVGSAMAAMVTLASQAALAANRPLIGTLRLVGARDVYIARAFVRRFTLRALLGAVIGASLGMAAFALVPRALGDTALVATFGFDGAEWALPALVPVATAAIAFAATRVAAFAALRRSE
ncbi:MAG: FtsX-like permease family protein [Pseudomonadota bacterium]